MATTASTTAEPPQPGYYHGESSSTTAEPEWVTEVLGRLKHSTTLPVMYTAPENMRLADRDDHIFEPILVSIGPFHHGKFQAMEEHKARIMVSMLYRLDDVFMRIKLMKLVNAVTLMEKEAREFYSKWFPEIDFVKMMVFDGCFILEIFRMHKGLYMSHGDDPIFIARWMLPALAMDIIKLENQLPYIVLIALYELTKRPEEPTLKDLAGSFLALLCPGLDRLMIEDDESQPHLLSLFHSTFAPSRNNQIPIYDEANCLNSFPSVTDFCIPIYDEANCLNSFPSVTDLCFSGIQVVKKKQGRSLLDIEYNDGKLKIPTLLIDHSTKILMRNLVAYEQCDKTVDDNFTSYVTFMDALVNSAGDVERLRVAGVINHFMNNNEDVSILLNNLTANIKFDMNKGYLASLNSIIYRDHHRALPQFRVRVRRLFNSLEGIVCIVTIVGSYLAVLQTVFAVLSYVHPKPN